LDVNVITQIDGRNRSERTPAELESLLMKDLSSLSPDEKEVLQVILGELAKGGKSGMLNLMAELEYEEPVVDIETWLREPYYFGKAQALRTKLFADMIELFSGDYYEVIMSGSLGYGKSYFAKVALCRTLYELSCMRNPQKSFGLAANSTVAIAALSITEKLSRKVLFEDITSMLKMSPYFMEKFKPTMTQMEIRFPKKIWVTCASSTSTSLLGLDLIEAILDETNFLGDMSREMKASHTRHGHVDNAELLYASVMRRIKSRYLRFGRLPGKIFLVSSKRTLTDFTERRILEARDDPHVFVREYSLWSVDRSKYSNETFKVLVGNDKVTSRIVSDPVEIEKYKKDDTMQLLDVPEDFKPDFERDLDSAIRDVGGIATVAIFPFIRNRERIDACVRNDYKHPFTMESWDMTDRGKFLVDQLFVKNEFGENVPKFHPKCVRHVHIDASIRGDATGICVAHTFGEKLIQKKVDGQIITETRPLIWVDLLLQVKPLYGEDIIFADLRKLIYALTELGMPIRFISQDSFQSFDSIQAFNARGYETAIISVDKPIDAYDTLKQALYDERLAMYDYPIVIEELKQLEFNIIKKKVDHRPDFHKDCISGDTCISLINGKEVSVRELVGKEVWLYACDQEGSVKPALGYNVHKVGDLTVMRVTLDNGKFFECTNDHEIMMRDGSFQKADHLKVNDSLMPLYRKKDVRDSKYALSGYEEIFDNKSKKFVFTHQLVAKTIFNFEYGKVGKKEVIHHKDFDKANNVPDNLEVMGWDEHRKLHNLVGKTNLKALWKNGEFLKSCIERSSKIGKITGPRNLTKYNKSKERIEKLKANGLFAKNGRKVMAKLWASEEYRQKHKARVTGNSNPFARKDIGFEDILKVASNVKTLKEIVNHFKCTEKVIFRILRDQGIDRNTFSKKYYGNCLVNHKISKIDYNVKVIDVYDLTVDKYHNFALSSGVFVHNCADALAGVCYSLSTKYSGEAMGIFVGDVSGQSMASNTEKEEKKNTGTFQMMGVEEDERW
jgi:hypothetical protein